ncbi:uncharacterized protein LOC133286858 isoform X2 [Gastrolobium bilobum]|uniref:uncharacterized protein LOC133286858 isoform X2 n=1 Tax=Gastrolobium bilobum TaxID=150636 RepID=UPI002AB2E9F4|nr:uncharacterized protein LOC133286858 isoform X2 [Gastrolobium bilobum]
MGNDKEKNTPKKKGTSTRQKRPKVAVDRVPQTTSNNSTKKRTREAASKETPTTKKASKSKSKDTRESIPINAQPPFDKDRFLSPECQERYETWFKPKLVIEERRINLEQPEQSSILEVIKRRKWEKFVTFPVLSPSTILKEFCANPNQEWIDQSRTSWVRGIQVRFDTNTIESFLSTSYNPLEECAFQKLLKVFSPINNSKTQYSPDIIGSAEKIRKRIALGKSCWVKNIRKHVPEKLARADLTADARFWYTFINSNIFPSTNASDVNLERAALICEILNESNVNILHMILNKRPEVRLGHSSLIMQLCERAGVEIMTWNSYHWNVLDVSLEIELGWNDMLQYIEDNKKQAPMQGSLHPPPQAADIPSTSQPHHLFHFHRLSLSYSNWHDTMP